MMSFQRFFAVLIGCLAAIARAQPVEPLHAPIALRHPIEDKNFYLLSALRDSEAARQAILHDSELTRIAAARLNALDHAVTSCNTDLGCYAAAFHWSDEQIADAGRALSALYRSSVPVRSLVDGPLRESGMYVGDSHLVGVDFLSQVWMECALGMNGLIDVYGLGTAPRYPEIDSATYDAKTPAQQRVVQNLALVLRDDRANLDLFFAPSERFALELMFLNNRDEAGRYEPLDQGENAAAFRKAKTVEWARYPYSVIVVPGAGNDRPGVRLSPGGKLRDEIAAKRWREGKAPFVLVSGGFVHPAHTEFAEAIEMKRDLMTRFGLPAEAIVVDPHARHTTTNMRNAARLIYRYGMPYDKKMLVATDLSQSQYIEGSAFAKRCTEELGYVPYKLLVRISDFDLEALPVIDSLQSDPRDPLDP
jgi:hypothetical protein